VLQGERVRVEVRSAGATEGAESSLVLRIPSDLGLVDEVVRVLVNSCLDAASSSPRTRFRFQVTLAEAVTNAIAFGNSGDRAKQVSVQADLFSDRVLLTVADEGSGFDPRVVPDPRHPDRVRQPCGRGLFLIRHLSDHVEFNEKGNTVWITLPRR
jgi:serine/threonine-protein kinase RsbW